VKYPLPEKIMLYAMSAFIIPPTAIVAGIGSVFANASSLQPKMKKALQRLQKTQEREG
jgi:hypothetical protein